METIPPTRLDTGWRKRQRLELRTLIYETTLELFRNQGIDKTTVQQVVSAAGIGKGTFFNHFPSKDHVLQEWYRQITKTALEEVSSNTFASGREAILALVVRLTLDVSADPYLWDAKDGATSSALLRKEEDDLNQEVLVFFKAAIERDVAENRLTPEVNADFLTDMILTVLTGTAHTWSISGHRQDLTKIIEARVSFVLDAALPHKGVK